MRKISATLFTAAVAISCIAGAAGAETYSKIVQQNCRADYKMHCADYGIESAALRSCMNRNGKNLSAGCVNALVQSGEVSQAEVNRRKKRPARSPATGATRNLDRVLDALRANGVELLDDGLRLVPKGKRL